MVMMIMCNIVDLPSVADTVNNHLSLAGYLPIRYIRWPSLFLRRLRCLVSLRLTDEVPRLRDFN